MNVSDVMCKLGIYDQNIVRELKVKLCIPKYTSITEEQALVIGLLVNDILKAEDKLTTSRICSWWRWNGSNWIKKHKDKLTWLGE